METQINKIIKNNAISAYLMFGISWAFLFVKKNKNINNPFVKNHTKSAFLIHLLIFINILIFRHYKVFWNINFYNFSLNNFISNVFFILSILTLFLWVYKAYKWDFFKIWEIFKINSEKKLLDINKDWNFWEKDKVTFILAFIPFFWQILTSKYSKHENIKEILKLNTFVSLIFCFLFINFYNNLNQILMLIYIIFVAFVWVNLFVKSELLIINLSKYFSFWELWKNFKIFFKYMKNYITWNFVEFKILYENEDKKIIQDQKITLEKMNLLNDLKWPKKIIYTPILNLFFIFVKENKNQIHIRNALIISFLMIFFITLCFLKIFSFKILILFLFPISFWIWNLEKIYYKIPFIYDLYELFSWFINFFKKSKKFISEKKKEVKEVKIKVWE